MRINKFVAQASGLSRRAADRAISEGRVIINQHPASLGDTVSEISSAVSGPADSVTLDGRPLILPASSQTVMLNKPVGYVCSRDGQGSRTIYELLPAEFHHLKPVGRLDKNSSGLLLLTDDGDLANRLTHPRYAKTKLYQITLDKPLTTADQKIISGHGVSLEDGLSQLQLAPRDNRTAWQVTMHQGRNRQIRRTFAALDYQVTSLHRTHFGDYQLDDISSGECKPLKISR